MSKQTNMTFQTPAIAIQLDESVGSDKSVLKKAPAKLQILRTGSFNHPLYGNFEIQNADLQSMKDNADKNIRKCDMALDYGHDSGGPAAAWLSELTLSDDGKGGSALFGVPSWTPNGAECVQNGDYKYVSADMMFEYQDAETGIKYGPTLLGAALTNRPFIKGMEAAQLSEGKGNQVNELETAKAKIVELEASIKGLSDKNAEILAQLSEKVKAIELSEIKTKELERNGAFDKMLSEGKVCEAQRAPFMANDMAKFAELAKVVKLAEGGNGSAANASTEIKDSADAQAKVLVLAETLVKEKKIPMKAAISQVLSENKELAKAYHG